MRTDALRLFGTDEPVEPAQVLRAGPLSLELQRGRLRHIVCAGREIWHGLVFVLRDADWGTPEPVIDHVDLQAADDHFEVHIGGHFPAAVAVPFRLHICGSADGEICLDAEAVPPADVSVNRLGLCLMHPRSVCGARVEVLHVDGRTSASSFPTLIPPWPPFMLVRALRHEWAPEAWAIATLDGELFETEDQRNNADASFKTYSRSNMAPRPYMLPAGVAVRQSARLRLEAAMPADVQPAAPLRVMVGEPVGAWPAVGIEVHPGDVQVPALREQLHALQPAHLHLAWRPGLDVDWLGMAELLAAADARLRLDVSLPADADAQPALSALKQALDRAYLQPESLAVFPSRPARIEAARHIFPGVPVGGGTPHFFVQLSRMDDRPALDFANFTTASVVHGADDDEVMLGLTSLPDMVATWRARYPQVPLRVGPSAIAARSSPLGAQPPSDGTRRLALAAVDPRSRAQFGAAWALGHVGGLASAGVQALTLLSLSGASGVVSVAGDALVRHPSFDLLATLGRSADRLATTVSAPERIAALALRRGNRRLVWIGNLTPEPLTVELVHEGTRAVDLEPYGTRCLVLD